MSHHAPRTSQLHILAVMAAILIGTSALGIVLQIGFKSAEARKTLEIRPVSICADGNTDCPVKDLPAQVRAAEAAELMGELSWWQTLAGLAGTAFLAFTLIYTMRSTRAAIIAAEAATAATEESKRTAERTLRPYISLAEMNHSWYYLPNDPSRSLAGWRFTIVWKNAGQTPADKIFAKTNASTTLGSEIPADFSFPDAWEGNGACGGLGPGLTLHSYVDVSLSDIQTAIAKRDIVLFWAWVEYEGLETNIRRRTEYCCTITFRGDPVDPLCSFFYSAQERFNGHDSFCSSPPSTR